MRQLSTIYPGKIIIDANNPDGTFKNEVTPGVSGDGTPLEEQWQQDAWGWVAHLLNKVSVSPNGAQENELNSQIYDAIETAVRNLFLIYDAANTYIKGAMVVASDDQVYKSLVAANLNNDPTSSPTEWLQIGTLADTTMAGLVELATPAENVAGTSDSVVPTSKGIREALDAVSAPPIFASRAWVNFAGSNGAINDSRNVSSVTDNAGNGDYTINFTTNMPNIDYTYTFGTLLNATGSNVRAIASAVSNFLPTVSALRINTNRTDTSLLINPTTVCVAVFA